MRRVGTTPFEAISAASDFSLDFWLVTTQGVRCELGYGTAVDLQADVKENPFRVVVQMRILV